jgi:release factor glutamine methyltransferase
MNILEEARWNELGQYDVIISNPPYIPENEKARLDKNVAAHEPLQALFVPDNQPLIFYEKIAAFGKKHLRKNGKIFMETHEDYARQVAALFVNEGYNAFVKQDFYEKDRMVIATRSR